MKFLIFIPPNDFRDESVSTFKMFFDRWSIESQISSYSTKECQGAHGAIYKPDINTNRAEPRNYDGIVLIDGPGIETYKLYEFRPFFDVLAKFNASKKYIFAVANAQRVLAKANLVKGKKMAAPEDQETQGDTAFPWNNK